MADAVGVDASGQPGLMALVTDAADWIRVGRPDAVLLVGEAVVQSRVRTSGVVLCIGLPALLCLSREEIRALVAHELAALDTAYPELVARLRALRTNATNYVQGLAWLAGLTRERCTAIVQATEAFGAAVEDRADAAATRTAGAHVAARALAKLTFARDDFMAFVCDIEEPVREYGLDVGVADIHDAWLTRLGYGRVSFPATLNTRAWARLKQAHPQLAAAMATLGSEDLDLTRRIDPVELAPLSVAEQRTLADGAYPHRYRDWIICAEVPPEVWRTDIERQHSSIIEQVANLLGRAPDGPAEVVDVLTNREAELLLPTVLNTPGPPPDLADGDPGVMLCTIAEEILVRRGWRRVHPAIHGLLIDPHGSEHDVLALARRAGAGDPAAQAQLVTLLEP